ncbi:hypothetical protein Sjap_020863 [Stephania japonica]|uniref:Tetratricopeptide repeat protein SKI3 n=1 Tax=Stephania japonica TaxID=461633 RepID=A0AAP0F2D8_9MAGN
MKSKEGEVVLNQLQDAVETDANNPYHHFNLGVWLWNKGEVEDDEEAKGGWRERAAEHFVISAKLDPANGAAFRYLGHLYLCNGGDAQIQRASKCYQRAVTICPDDFEAGEALCDLFEDQGKMSLELALCRECSNKSPKAFWAFRRLGFLLVHQKKWSEAVHPLQHAIRGYPTCADLWETLGLAYQRLGMFTAAIKSYERAIELEDSRLFALVECGNIFLMLGSYRKGVERFRLALDISSDNVAAKFGLATALLGLSKECIRYGAFVWAASLLEEATEIAKASACMVGTSSCIWKLLGDIQLAYAKCFPWTGENQHLGTEKEGFICSINDWKRKCGLAAIYANRSFQRALHLTPWLSNIYIDVATSIDLISSLEETSMPEEDVWQLPEKMSLGGLLIEGMNTEFWVALGCLSSNSALKQHALIRALQLDVSLAVAWAYLGKLYRIESEMKLTKHSFDHARSIDPSLALPWANMSTDANHGGSNLNEAYESCQQAVHILPVVEFQIGLGELAVLSGHLLSPQAFGAIRQAVQRAPHYPEPHNLIGLMFEARSDYKSAIAAYKLAQYAISTFSGTAPKSHFHVSVNLARALCLARNFDMAVHECETLDKEGLLDSIGLQIYAVSLCHLGRNDLALSVLRNIAVSVSSMDKKAAAVPISLIFKLLYHISGIESTMTSILKMPSELLRSSKISFVISAIDALDHSNRVKSAVNITRESLVSLEEITRMHTLIAFGKLIKDESIQSLEIQSGIDHLKKALHMYPHSIMIRNQLGHLLLCNKELNASHTATRCITINHPSNLVTEGMKSAFEILGASAVACNSVGTSNPKFSFPTCKGPNTHGMDVIRQLQRWLRLEPWNPNAWYLLLLNIFQKAREERFPHHLYVMFKRLIYIALSNEIYEKDLSYQYKKFQLLLCASEMNLQGRDQIGCHNCAIDASALPLPDDVLFFVHLLLCRIYAALENFQKLQEEYMNCLQLKTNHPMGWICLKFFECRYQLQNGSNIIDINFEECPKKNCYSSNMWTAIFKMVQSQSHIWNQDFLVAEETLSKGCLCSGAESCLFLCHGVLCMKLARKHGISRFLPLAVTSLMVAQKNSPTLLPLISALIALAEASLGARENWEKNLQIEWLSWPAGARPAESYFQMHLLSRQLKWLLQAIHLNPSFGSCLRLCLRAITLMYSRLHYYNILDELFKLVSYQSITEVSSTQTK